MNERKRCVVRVVKKETSQTEYQIEATEEWSRGIYKIIETEKCFIVFSEKENYGTAA